MATLCKELGWKDKIRTDSVVFELINWEMVRKIVRQKKSDEIRIQVACSNLRC
jgi:hypothetical protein